MKRITYISLSIIISIFIGCSDYLDTTNPGQSDDAFVMSTADEAFKTLSFAYAEYRRNCAHGGNYNYQDPLGSDAEYMSEFPTATTSLQATTRCHHHRLESNTVQFAQYRACPIGTHYRSDSRQKRISNGCHRQCSN